jgi:hypothetical protein
MSMRNRDATESADLDISRSLKAWAGQKRPPAMGRVHLMQAAAASAFAPAWVHSPRRQGTRPHRRDPSEWSWGLPRQAIGFWFLGDVTRFWLRC